MNHRSRAFHSIHSIRVLLALVASSLLLLLLIGGQAARAADNRSLRWERWDVTIDNMVPKDNVFDVTEAYVLAIETGPYRFGTASIPLGRVTSIDNVQITEEGTPLTAGCSSSAGTFCVTRSGGNLNVQYYFRTPANSGTRRNISFSYTVRGALRSYPEGDELDWIAIPGDHPFPVRNSSVTVNMPSGYTAKQFGSDPKTWRSTTQGDTIIWTSPGTLDTGEGVEIGVQYPHDAQMAAAPWQAAFDRNRVLEAQLTPIIGLGGIVLGLLFAIGGPVLMYIQYAKRGRDPEAVVVPEYLSEPPSDEAPGVVGTLVDESADMQDIMATLIDLGRRGYLVIEQSQEGGVGGLFQHTEFTFHRGEKAASDLRYSHEKTLYNALFPYGQDSTTLSSLRNRFYTNIPVIKRNLYEAVVKNEYFVRSPDTTRNMWIGIGIGILVVAGLVGYGAYMFLMRFSILSLLPAFGIGVTGFAAMVAASFMPAKTAKGSQEKARWNAFRNYLTNIKHYTDIQQAGDQFDRYIAYAVAFGLDRQWIHEFAPVLTSMPTWYYPTYLGGPWVGGYHRNTPMFMPGGMPTGGIQFGGPGNLNDMSRSLTDGLNAMSTGLTKMLNDASSVMTSKPSSSGGSSFGGGGFSGGGGGGGGSRGFG